MFKPLIQGILLSRLTYINVMPFFCVTVTLSLFVMTPLLWICILSLPARRFRPSSEFRLLCWLEQHGLGYYYENFRLSDLNDLQQLERLDLTEQMFDELEMDVPAHRKRLHKAGECWVERAFYNCRHFDEIFITGGTGSFHFDNFHFLTFLFQGNNQRTDDVVITKITKCSFEILLKCAQVNSDKYCLHD